MAMYNIKKSNIHIYSAIGQLADIMIEIINHMPIASLEVDTPDEIWADETIKRLEQIKENDERNIRGR